MKKAFLLAAVVCLGIVLAAPTSAMADGKTVCVGVLPPGVYENAVVPPGAACRIESSIVLGNVRALPRSQLVIDSSTVQGDVVGTNADVVDVFDFVATPGASVVGGDISAKGGNGYFRVCGTTLSAGDIEVEKFVATDLVIGGDSCTALGSGNTVLQGSVRVARNAISFPNFEIVDNVIAEELVVVKNTGPFAKVVVGNVVGQRVACFDNDPPFLGGPNVAPEIEGQCF